MLYLLQGWTSSLSVFYPYANLFWSDIPSPQRMNLNNFGAPLTLRLTFRFLVKCLDYCWMDHHSNIGTGVQVPPEHGVQYWHFVKSAVLLVQIRRPGLSTNPSVTYVRWHSRVKVDIFKVFQLHNVIYFFQPKPWSLGLVRFTWQLRSPDFIRS